MQDLTGKRILCVEDEPLIAMTLTLYLEDAGCVIIGPAFTAARALDLLSAFECDAAVLDVNLGGGNTSASVADELRRRKIPFLFATGYSEQALRPDDRGTPRIGKPYSEYELFRGLRRCMTTAGFDS